MSRSPLHGRRVHVSGSVSKDAAVASGADADAAQEFVNLLVSALVRKGANFVVPVDADPRREATAGRSASTGPSGRPLTTAS